MNKKDAKLIAEKISNKELSEMFQRAKESITDWEKVSNVNKGMTKGVSWNVLASNFDINHKYHILAKVNMVREFGEFLPDDMKPKKKTTKTKNKPFHQDPKL
jgi:hypothetical protein